MKTSAPRTASLSDAVERSRRWCCRRSTRSDGFRSARPRWMTPSTSATTTCLAPASISSRTIAEPAAPAPDITIRTSPMLLVDDAQGVGQRGQHHDRGAVLVVVEHRDVEQLAQPRLDLEAARRRDVLEVDAGEHRRDHLHGAHDLVDVLGVEAERPGVDAGEPLEQRRLALHHRQRGLRPDVAEPEHGRAVGDDRDRVALDRQPAGVARGSRRSPGRPARRPACRPSTGRRGCGSDAWTPSRSCRRGASGTSGRRPCARRRPRRRAARRRSRRRGRCREPRRSRRCAAGRRPDAVTSSAVTMPPAASTTLVSWLTAVPPAGTHEPDGDRVRDGRRGGHAPIMANAWSTTLQTRNPRPAWPGWREGDGRAGRAGVDRGCGAPTRRRGGVRLLLAPWSRP